MGVYHYSGIEISGGDSAQKKNGNIYR